MLFCSLLQGFGGAAGQIHLQGFSKETIEVPNAASITLRPFVIHPSVHPPHLSLSPARFQREWGVIEFNKSLKAKIWTEQPAIIYLFTFFVLAQGRTMIFLPGAHRLFFFLMGYNLVCVAGDFDFL